MNEKIIAAIHEVFVFANHVDDWMVIKKEILKSLRAEERTAFSTRHPLTKRQVTNEFERNVAKYWEGLTHRPVIFKDDDKRS